MAVLLCILALLAGQQETSPKLATVHGRVMDAVTGRPIAMARVRVALDARTQPVEFAAQTGDDGRYRVDGLPAGRYVVTASKARYVPLQHGQRLPSATGRPVEIGAGAIQQIDIALPRSGAIVGRVVDEAGEPVERAVVTAMKVGYTAGRRGFVPAGQSAQTNDAGEYRVYALPPGSYYVLVSERSGGFGYEGDADVGFLQTMYPAATTAADARSIPVAFGQDVAGIDIVLMPARTATLSGVVTTSRGQPGAMVKLNLSAVDVPFGLGGQTQTTADGRFSFPRLLPGRYELHARKGGYSDRPGEEPEGAVSPVTIAGDMLDLPVPLTRGGRLIGVVVTPEGSTAKPQDVMLVASPIGDTLVFGVGFGEALKDDWTFEWPFLIAARVIRPSRVPPGWYMSSVLRGGDDITDTPTVFRDPDEVRVTLAADGAQLAGSVAGGDGKTTDDYTVVLFPDDASKWNVRSRFIRTARPDQKGAFKIESLVPGQYLAAAVETIEQEQWFNTEFLARLKRVATSISLESNGRHTIALRLVKP